LLWEAADSETGADPKTGTIAVATTSGSPGPVTIPLFPDHQVLYQRDIDSDGTIETVSYLLMVELPVGPASGVQMARLPEAAVSGIQMVRILWTRTLSNPPAAATFNDVPTGHVFFRFVEALADAGIVAGCGGGNFCPTAPLSRGQFAVLLSSALGLNWDQTQTEPNP
jgi:hypothetical protein